MGPTWGPPGSCRPQMGHMKLALYDIIAKQILRANLYIVLESPLAYMTSRIHFTGTVKGIGSMKKISSASRFPLHQYLSCNTHSNSKLHTFSKICVAHSVQIVAACSRGCTFRPDCCSLPPWLHIPSRLLQLAPVAAHSVQIVAACSRDCTFRPDCCSLPPWLHIPSRLLQLAPVAAHSVQIVAACSCGCTLSRLLQLAPMAAHSVQIVAACSCGCTLSRLLQLAPVAAHSVQIVAACSCGCTLSRLLQLVPVAAHLVQIVAACSRGCTFGPDCCSLFPWLHIRSRLLQLAPVAAHSVQIVAVCSRGCTFGPDFCSLLPWLHIRLTPSAPPRHAGGGNCFPFKSWSHIYTRPEICHHFSCWSSSLLCKVIVYRHGNIFFVMFTDVSTTFCSSIDNWWFC